MAMSAQIVRRQGLRAGMTAAFAVLMFWLATTAGEDAFGAAGFTIGSTLLTGAALWLWSMGAEEAIDHRALRSLGTSGRKKGDWVAVAGLAVPLGETMKATLSDRVALACHYEVIVKQRGATTRGGSRSTHLGMLYEGHHVVPTGIKTDTGTVPLRALPDLVNLEKSGVGRGESKLDTTAVPADKYQRAIARAQLAAETSDRFDRDWKYGDAAVDGTIVRKEWVLSPDEPVCILGCWDGEGLTPSGRRPRGLPVFPGTAEQVRARLGGGSKAYFGVGAVPALLVAWWAYTIVR